jgi:hypothetical protein
MRTINVFISIMFLAASCTNKQFVTKTNANSIEVVILLNKMESYCGGARPTEEMLAEINLPKPMMGERLYLRKGSVNNVDEPVVASETTDSSGRAIFHLSPGQYCVVRIDKSNVEQHDKWKRDLLKGNELYAPVDVECLKKWLYTPEMIIEVYENGLMEFELVINKPCPWNAIPCAQYIGPLPG